MITVLQPDVTVPLDRFSDWIAEEGQDYRVIPLEHQPVPALDDCGDGIIVLGGRKDAVTVSESPFLEDVYELLREAVDREVPVLGICLGHQILGHAFGGTVTLGHPAQGEEGAYDVTLTAAGSADPLFSGLDETFLAAESHHDVVEVLPEDATLLATSKACPNQAFRIGSAVSVQFHPEVSPATMGKWTAGDGGDGAAMAAHMTRVDEKVRAGGRIIARNFVRIVTGTN